MPEQNDSSGRRLFFGLQPSRADRELLHASIPPALRRGRRLAPENLHLTLVFLGGCDSEREALAREAAATVSAAPGCVVLDTLEVWRGPGVQVLTPQRVSDSLRNLQADLGHALAERGFEVDQRSWRPHMTLARGVRPHRRRHLPAVSLWFDRYSLLVSHRVDGRLRYDRLAHWRLTARTGDSAVPGGRGNGDRGCDGTA